MTNKELLRMLTGFLEAGDVKSNEHVWLGDEVVADIDVAGFIRNLRKHDNYESVQVTWWNDKDDDEYGLHGRTAVVIGANKEMNGVHLTLRFDL